MSHHIKAHLKIFPRSGIINQSVFRLFVHLILTLFFHFVAVVFNENIVINTIIIQEINSSTVYMFLIAVYNIF